MTGNKAKTAPAKKKVTSKASSSNRDASCGPQRVLDCILTIENQQLGNPEVPRKTILSLSGFKSNTFTVMLSTMKNKQGLITYDKDYVRLTDLGRSRASSTMPIATDNASVQANLKEKFKVGGKAGLLFDALVDGQVHDRAAVAAAIGCDNKATLAVMLSNMKKNGIIQYDRTTIQLADICFPLGRPE